LPLARPAGAPERNGDQAPAGCEGGGQGTAQCAPLVPQRGVLRDDQGPGQQLLTPLIGYCGVHELDELLIGGYARSFGRVHERIGGVIAAQEGE
jgi:hypothetical protein